MLSKKNPLLLTAVQVQVALQAGQAGGSAVTAGIAVNKYHIKTVTIISDERNNNTRYSPSDEG